MPLPAQYAVWLRQMVQLSQGVSHLCDQSVASLIAVNLPRALGRPLRRLGLAHRPADHHDRHRQRRRPKQIRIYDRIRTARAKGLREFAYRARSVSCPVRPPIR